MSDVISLTERAPDSIAALSHQLIESLAVADAPANIKPVAGVYPSIDFIDYALIDAASNSRLSRLVPPSTPAHCLAYMMTPPAKTPALILGDATHCAILEPDRFDREYIRQIEGDGRTKAVRDARERQAIDYPNATIVSAADYETTMRVGDAVRAHPAARVLLDMVERRNTELSIVWRDPVTGEMCKGRIDAAMQDIIIDLKSTKNASKEAFARAISFYGYHRQGAMYQDGANTLRADVGMSPFQWHIFIAYEKVPPYAVAVYRLNDASMNRGRAELAPLIVRYAECRRSGVWPAYSDDIEDIDVPAPFDAALLEGID